MSDPTFGSLFAGVGGFDLGFEAAGWQCSFQVEWDKHCQTVLNRHWPDVPKWSDVSDVNGAEIPPVDCITFGSPCQDLSVAGKRAGLDGSRSNLFYQAIRIIKEMRDATANQYPKVVVWENVPGALNSNQGADFAAVLDSLADIGALVIEWNVLDACWFGVPQRRRRIFLVAVFDPATASRCGNQIFSVGQGKKGNPETSKTIIGFYSKQGKHDKPNIDCLPPLTVATSIDIVTTCAIVGNGIRSRRLTPIECERAMGWPDNHTAGQADSHRYKQCGNGVAAPVAQWVAGHLRELVNV